MLLEENIYHIGVTKRICRCVSKSHSMYCNTTGITTIAFSESRVGHGTEGTLHYYVHTRLNVIYELCDSMTMAISKTTVYKDQTTGHLTCSFVLSIFRISCTHSLLITYCSDDKIILINITLLDLREIGWDGVDWIDRAQDRDQWRALVNTISNLRLP
jgi:hypothetical protein